MSSAALRLLPVVLLGLLAVALVPADEPKKPPTKEQVAQWIKELGSDEFDKREEASKKLWEAGQPAEAALEEAAKSKDEEVARRSKEILEKFKYGIYPDTPKKVADLITSYHNADDNTRPNIIKELLETGTHGSRAAIKLANAEKEPAAKTRALQVLSAQMNHAVAPLLKDNDFTTLEMLLDMTLVSGDVKSGAANYTAYYLQRGQLDAGIGKVKDKKDIDDKRKQEMLAYMYRAKGDAKAARAAAEAGGQPELVDELLFESSDWKELAKRFQLNAAGKEIEKLGYGAAYHRLAGNQKEFEETIAAIIKYADTSAPADKPSNSFYAAKALFLNDRPEDALKVLKAGGRSDVAFEILCVQLRFNEAFELLEKIKKDGGETAPLVEILAARTLYNLGEKDKAKPMFAKVAAAIKPGGNDYSWIEELIDAEVRVGLRDDAFEHAAQTIEQFKDGGWPSRLLPKLFPGRGDAAEVWYTHMHSTEPDAKPADLLKKVRTLLEGKAADKDVEKLLTDAEATARTKMMEELDRWTLALADTALQYKKEDTALAMLHKTQSAAALQRIGDLHAEKKQWGKAAEQYLAAWEKDKHQTLSLYLHGQALAKNGRAADGKKMMDLAHWLPLGDETARHMFAVALTQRGLAEASRSENDLLVRISQPGQYYAGEAQRRMALDALAKKDYLKAADGHEKAMLRCLKTYISFLQKGAYVGVPTHVHRLRARGLLEAGKPEDARKEITAAQALLPGDVDLAILLVPVLEKRGEKKEANDIYDKSLAVYDKMCKDYPNCPWAHNSAAWLSVCCRRNLDAAKVHAVKATELAPTNAGHQDTLAEIYFQLGDKDKAIATQKKAIELDPKKAYFKKQLKRIEAGDPKAERPSENDDDE
jgi:hypothetical protein